MVEIGLFPLGLVLVPGERLPLHIFEPRYRELVGDCLALEHVFGLVLQDEEGLRAIGTTAAVTDVLERFDDGRLNIVVEGRERFRIVTETRGAPFEQRRYAPSPIWSSQPTADELEACVVAYRGSAADAPGPSPMHPVQTQGRSPTGSQLGSISASARKQELLELLSERERTTRLTGLLRQARAVLRFSRTAHERASTNGRVEPPLARATPVA